MDSTPFGNTLPEKAFGLPLSAPASVFKWAAIAYGVTTVLLGVLLLSWPGVTLLVAVALLAVQFIVTGVLSIIRSLVAPPGAGERTLLAIAGAVAILVGLLVLRRPLQTLVIVTLLVGASWVVGGIMDIAGAVPSDVPHRGWHIVLGFISIVAGVIVLLNPGLSLLTLVWISGIWMIVFGAVLVIATLLAGRPALVATSGPVPEATPPPAPSTP